MQPGRRGLPWRALAPFTAKVTAADEVGSVALRGNTGGRSAEHWRGIFHRIKDPTSSRSEELRDVFALQGYEAVRAGDKVFDGAAMSRSAGMTEDEVGQALEHVFVDEHLMKDLFEEGATTVQRFDPNPDVYEAFERLERGDPHPADVTLLWHELVESRHMRADPGLRYDQAHELTRGQGYDWIWPSWKNFYVEG